MADLRSSGERARGSELAIHPLLVKEMTAKCAWTLALVLAAASVCCGGAANGAAVSPIRAEETSSPDAHALTLAALDCFMRPVVYDTPASEKSNERSRASVASESGGCVT